MRSRSFVAVAVTVFGLFAGAGAVLAYDHAQSHTLAKGITVGGINVGGLSVSQARARLRSAYVARLNRPVVLHYAGRRFTLSPGAAHLTVDVEGSVQEALARSRSDNLIVRVLRSLTGGQVRANIDPQVRFSHRAVARLVGRAERALDHPARDASISYSADSISRVPSAPGLAVRAGMLTARIDDSLIHGAASHRIRIPVTRTLPKVTSRQLSSQYPTIITIDRGAFTLRLWKHLRMVKSYTIAVGQVGLATPAGLYHIQDKEVDPSWHVPNSSWAGSLAGQTIPPGPQDPLKARWMGIFNGAGIHGTDALSSLGTAASHGCIRMSIPDVIELYSQTPLGAPVYIA